MFNPIEPAQIEDLARAAGREILAVYASAFAATAKADDSPLTEADLRAHRVIVAGLAQLTPDIPVLSEESAAIDYAQRATWQRYWLVDPLDGTKEFIARNGEFTVNIALIENQRAVFGVVHIPVTDTTYTGIVGQGAWRESPQTGRSAIRVRTPAASPLRVLGSRSHGNPALATALDAMGPYELQAVGSSIKLCLLAEGAADLYPRLGPTSHWDIAAGQAVLEAAGGHVARLPDLSVLRYAPQADFLNPHFIACGDASLLARWPCG